MGKKNNKNGKKTVSTTNDDFVEDRAPSQDRPSSDNQRDNSVRDLDNEKAKAEKLGLCTKILEEKVKKIETELKTAKYELERKETIEKEKNKKRASTATNDDVGVER
ncbi:hypothetical protein PENTCL1PPCAC_19205, partial [Pristionchus entomophagus]